MRPDMVLVSVLSSVDFGVAAMAGGSSGSHFSSGTVNLNAGRMLDVLLICEGPFVYVDDVLDFFEDSVACLEEEI